VREDRWTGTGARTGAGASAETSSPTADNDCNGAIAAGCGRTNMVQAHVVSAGAVSNSW
jgi:hypothetical protein